MATLLCEFRIKHDDWGARKVLTVLQGRYPWRREWPDDPGAPAIHTEAPNDLWTADFKGEFRTGDGIYC